MCHAFVCRVRVLGYLSPLISPVMLANLQSSLILHWETGILVCASAWPLCLVLGSPRVCSDLAQLVLSVCVCLSSSIPAISNRLDETLGSSAKSTLAAIGAQEAALTAIAVHTQKLKEAMDAEVRPGVQHPRAERLLRHFGKGNANGGPEGCSESVVKR